MVESAVILLSRQGVGGVTIDAVLADAKAPRGSVYHHFPGGREQLLEEAGRLAADRITSIVESAVDADPAAALRTFVGWWVAALEASDFRATCPVTALALDQRDAGAAGRDIARDAFGAWQDALTTLLSRRTGEREAQELATLAIAAIEGAIVLACSERSVDPLLRVERRLVGLLPTSE